MKRNSFVLTALLLASGPALAQYTLPSIQVRPDTGGDAMSFSCQYRHTPRPTDVEALLQINDRTQTQRLSNKLMDAVAEACAEGVSTMVVERGSSGRSLTWYPVGGYPTTVAGPVYYQPAPVYYKPAPVYVEPAQDDVPAYVEPVPTYYDPSTGYYEPAPVYVEPVPAY